MKRFATASPSISIRSICAVLLATAAVALLRPAPGAAQCFGDCNGDGIVSTNELVLIVQIALDSSPISACPSLTDTVTIDEVVTAVDNSLGECGSSSRPTATPTPTPMQQPTATPTVIQMCSEFAGMVDVNVVVQAPDATTFGALQVFLEYPDGVVDLPGSGNQAHFSIDNLPEAFSFGFNDVDYAVYVSALDPVGFTLGSPPPNLFFTAHFKLCAGASPPSASDFNCTVVNATLPDNTVITDQTTCSASL